MAGRQNVQRAHRGLLAIVACVGLAPSPLAAQQFLDRAPVERTAALTPAHAAAPVETGSTPRTPIRRDRDAGADPAVQPDQGSLSKTFVMLGLILGGLYLALRVVRRCSPAASAASQRGGLIEVIASRRLDTQSAVHLVRIGPRVLAVGASPAGLTTLGMFDSPAEIAEFLGAGERPSANAALFSGTRAVRRGGPTSSQLPDGQPSGMESRSHKLVRGGPHG